MKRLYAWLAGLAGGAAAYRVFRRQPRAEPPVATPDPAEELKAKLAEARAGDEQRSDPDPDVDARRRSVHDRAREAIDEMQAAESPDPETR